MLPPPETFPPSSCFLSGFFFFFNCIFFFPLLEILFFFKLKTYNVALVTSAQQSDSVIHTYISIPFQILFRYNMALRLLIHILLVTSLGKASRLPGWVGCPPPPALLPLRLRCNCFLCWTFSSDDSGSSTMHSVPTPAPGPRPRRSLPGQFGEFANVLQPKAPPMTL